MAAMSIWLLPDPDSPTIPTHSAGCAARDAARTAASVPDGREYWTLKFSMAKTGAEAGSLSE